MALPYGYDRRTASKADNVKCLILEIGKVAACLLESHPSEQNTIKLIKSKILPCYGATEPSAYMFTAKYKSDAINNAFAETHTVEIQEESLRKEECFRRRMASNNESELSM